MRTNRAIAAVAVLASLCGALFVAACGGGDETKEAAPAEMRRASELQVGDCWNRSDSSKEEEPVYEVVSCDTPHKAEVVRLGLPSDDKESSQALADCLGVSPAELETTLNERSLEALGHWDQWSGGHLFLASTSGKLTQPICAR